MEEAEEKEQMGLRAKSREDKNVETGEEGSRKRRWGEGTKGKRI